MNHALPRALRVLRPLLTTPVLLGAAVMAHAQGGTFPEKSINWIVGWPAGGSADSATRLIARRIEQTLGQSVVDDNRAGASGAIALQAAVKAPADGYTLITVPGPVLMRLPVPQVGKELTGVAMLGKGPAVLVGTMAKPLPPTVKDLIAAAKAKPNDFAYASSGNGTAQHLAGELFNQLAGTAITHVPYKGGTQAVTDVVGGQVPLAVLGITAVLPHIKAGKLHAYAVTTATRSPSLPDVPTMQEAGLPGFEATQWFMVAVPKGTPPERIAKLNGAINQALKDPEVAKGFATVGIAPETASGTEATQFVQKDQQRWDELAKKANLALD